MALVLVQVDCFVANGLPLDSLVKLCIDGPSLVSLLSLWGFPGTNIEFVSKIPQHIVWKWITVVPYAKITVLSKFGVHIC